MTLPEKKDHVEPLNPFAEQKETIDTVLKNIDNESRKSIGMTYLNEGIYFMNENMPEEAVDMLKKALALTPWSENVQEALKKAEEIVQRSSDK